jgi:hypothetical protein
MHGQQNIKEVDVFYNRALLGYYAANGGTNSYRRFWTGVLSRNVAKTTTSETSVRNNHFRDVGNTTTSEASVRNSHFRNFGI